MFRIVLTALFVALPCFAASATAWQEGEPADDPGADQVPASLDFMVKSIDGKDVNLAEKYKGRVLVVVNVASKCGLTPQYEGLQNLYEEYSDEGLSVLGFPCNQFGRQEPGTEQEIAAFCEDNYGVTFDMFSKINVNGKGADPLYAWLTQQETKPQGAGDISWNFEKFVIDRKGNLIARFNPRTRPDDPEFVAAIRKALAEK